MGSDSGPHSCAYPVEPPLPSDDNECKITRGNATAELLGNRILSEVFRRVANYLNAVKLVPKFWTLPLSSTRTPLAHSSIAVFQDLTERSRHWIKIPDKNVEAPGSKERGLLMNYPQLLEEFRELFKSGLTDAAVEGFVWMLYSEESATCLRAVTGGCVEFFTDGEANLQWLYAPRTFSAETSRELQIVNMSYMLFVLSKVFKNEMAEGHCPSYESLLLSEATRKFAAQAGPPPRPRKESPLIEDMERNPKAPHQFALEPKICLTTQNTNFCSVFSLEDSELLLSPRVIYHLLVNEFRQTGYHLQPEDAEIEHTDFVNATNCDCQKRPWEAPVCNTADRVPAVPPQTSKVPAVPTISQDDDDLRRIWFIHSRDFTFRCCPILIAADDDSKRSTSKCARCLPCHPTKALLRELAELKAGVTEEHVALWRAMRIDAQLPHPPQNIP